MSIKRLQKRINRHKKMLSKTLAPKDENLRESHSGVPVSRGFLGGRLSPLTIATSVKLKALQFYWTGFSFTGRTSVKPKALQFY